MSIMAPAEPAKDPLTEHDDLTSELANLEKQFADRKLDRDKFEVLSRQLNERIRRAESEAYEMARKDESVARRLRLRTYNDPQVQPVISHFIRTGGKMLEPEFGTDRLPRYAVGDASGDNIMLVERPLLQRMADIRIVAESLFERVLYCPRCATPSNLYSRFKCTQCGSMEISISRMIEHLACGTIHQETAFRVGKSLICPTCKKLLENEKEYRLIGVVCSCNICHAHFEDPSQSYYCRKCSLDFDLPKAMIVDVFAYSMTKEALGDARRFLGVDALRRVLGEKGFDVRSPGVMAGTSEEVSFAVLVHKDMKTIAIDISQSESEVDVEPVLELYVKKLETNPTVVVLAAIPRLSKRASEIAALHNIQVAEGVTPVEVAGKVLEIAVRA
jgi:hypothetical protein